MRLDVFLKLSRLIKTRTLARDFAKKGLVDVNSVTAKPSSSIAVGDEITIRRADSVTKVVVSAVPKSKQVSKKDAPDLYELIDFERIELI